MTDYMRALYVRFCIPTEADVEAQAAIEATRRELLEHLSRPERKLLMRLTDLTAQFCDELALKTFTVGYKLADGIRLELAETGIYSFTEEDEANACQKHEGGMEDAL